VKSIMLPNHDSDLIRDATRQLEKNPSNVVALMARAEGFLKLHNSESALRDIERSLHIALAEPRLVGRTRGVLLARLYTMQSRALAGLGQWGAASMAVDRALEEKAGDVEALMQRGRIRRETGDFHGALKDFNGALATDSRFAMAYVGRGMTHFELQDYSSAISDYDQALNLDQHLAVGWSNRGNAHVFVKRKGARLLAEKGRVLGDSSEP
jgi:tetratricopeptide (TPR) repeat protein